MPVDGSGTRMRETDGNGELASRRDEHSGGRPNPGESGGGPYPNPHSGKDGGEQGGFMDHGGQTDASYYGSDNHNAPNEED